MAVINTSPYKGSGQITREQFLFFEMRTTAKLMSSGLDDKALVDQIVEENMFQYPTEKTIRQIARACVRRLHGLNDEALMKAIAFQSSEEGKQICLYAMMKEYRLIWDFMITVIGTKYRQQDQTFSRRDINVFLMQLQEQDDYVASWSESTCKKIGAVISRILIENEYIDNWKADRLNPVLLSSLVEDAIRENGDQLMLPAFNCLN